MAYERRLQIWLVQQFRRHVEPWHAVLMMAAGNDAATSDDSVGLLSAMGLVPGATDLVLLTDRGTVRWIEVKLEQTLRHQRTGLSDTQREHHDLLSYLGHRMDVVRSLDDLLAILAEEQVPHSFPPRLVQPTFDFRRRRPATP